MTAKQTVKPATPDRAPPLLGKEWIDAGHGEFDEVIERLPPGKWTLIYDSKSEGLMGRAYFYTALPYDQATELYRDSGGTITRAAVVDH